MKNTGNNHNEETPKKNQEKREELDLSDLEESEQANLQKFVRVAKKKGTKSAIKALFGGLQNSNQHQTLFEQLKQENAKQGKGDLLKDKVESSEKNVALLLLKKAQEEKDEFSQATESESESDSSDEVNFEKRQEQIKQRLHLSMKDLDELHCTPRKKKTGILSPLKRSGTGNSDKKYRLKLNKKKKKWRCLINVNNDFKIVWDNTILVLIFYIAIFSPFKISFIDDSAYPYWTYFDYFIDFIFALDLILNFFTPIYKNHRFLKSHKKIALRYLRVWFWLDLLTIIPFDVIFHNERQAGQFLLSFINMPKLYRMFRLLKMIRAIKLKQKNKTYIVKKLTNFLNSESLVSKIVPLYAVGILISYMFACLWHFVPKENPDRFSWLQRYNFLNEPTHDRFWASVYYIYATVTTTGYGDITPFTKQEFGLTVMFVGFGVSFHSLIYTTMVKNIEAYRKKTMRYNEKLKFLYQMKKKYRLLLGKEGNKIYKEMNLILEEAQSLNLIQEKEPNLENLSEDIKIRINLEICERHHRFDKIQFFRVLPRGIWLRFMKAMETRIYSIGDIIFHKGEKPTNFFVIKSGEVWFMQKQKELGTYPFIQVDSYFGEIEIFDEETKLKWTVAAKSPVVVFAISKNDLLSICDDYPEFRRSLHKKMVERLKFFQKSDRECGRAIRRVGRVNKKIQKMKEHAMKNAVKSIHMSKKVGNQGKWHEVLLSIRNKEIEKKLEKGREERKKRALDKLQAFHKLRVKENGDSWENRKRGRRGAIGFGEEHEDRSLLQRSAMVSPELVDRRKRFNGMSIGSGSNFSSKNTNKTRKKKKIRIVKEGSEKKENEDEWEI